MQFPGLKSQMDCIGSQCTLYFYLFFSECSVCVRDWMAFLLGCICPPPTHTEIDRHKLACLLWSTQLPTLIHKTTHKHERNLEIYIYIYTYMYNCVCTWSVLISSQKQLRLAGAERNTASYTTSYSTGAVSGNIKYDLPSANTEQETRQERRHREGCLGV